MLRVDAIDEAGYRERNDRFSVRKACPIVIAANVVAICRDTSSKSMMKKKRRKKEKKRKHRTHCDCEIIPVDYPATSTAKPR